MNAELIDNPQMRAVTPLTQDHPLRNAFAQHLLDGIRIGGQQVAGLRNLEPGTFVETLRDITIPVDFDNTVLGRMRDLTRWYIRDDSKNQRAQILCQELVHGYSGVDTKSQPEEQEDSFRATLLAITYPHHTLLIELASHSFTHA